MTRALHYVRRAFELPPREAVKAARELTAYHWAAWQQRIARTLGPDPLNDNVFGRRIGISSVREREACAARLFTRPDAVLPVKCPATIASMCVDRVREIAAEAMAHRFDLLGSGPTHVALSNGAEQRQRRCMEELLAGASADYAPIDWHADFKSGYRWPADQWFSQIQYGHVPGVDVKVPWELSRFQHIGALGLVYRFEPGGLEGRRAAGEFRAQIVDWIAANPAGRGVNWACPMDIALRAVSWLTGMALFEGAPELTPSFRWLVAKSLHAHGRHIEANLEYNRGKTGNHYLSDVVGLLCIGAAMPELPESSRWCLFGIQELTSELEHQVLSDGVDIEGSVPYHHLVAELFLIGTLVALRLGRDRRAHIASAQLERIHHSFAPQLRPLPDQRFDLHRAEIFPDWYLDRLLHMAEFAADVTKADGRIPQIGDNDNGRAYQLSPSPVAGLAGDVDPCDRRTVLAVAGRLFGDPRLAASGRDFAIDAHLLVADAPAAAVRAAVDRARADRNDAVSDVLRVFRSADAELRIYGAAGVAIVRTRRLYLAISFCCVPRASSGGHFHNDLLGFELQWDGIDFIVDGGSYVYTPEPSLRDAFRSTAAHNTIFVPGMEQRTWPTGAGRLFAVQRDATVRILEAAPTELAAEAIYGEVSHIRRFAWGDDWLRIEDSINAPKPADLLLNMDPSLNVSRPAEPGAEQPAFVVERAGRRLELRLQGVGAATLADGYYSVGYGRRLQNGQLRAELIGNHATAAFTFTGAAHPAGTPVRAQRLEGIVQ